MINKIFSSFFALFILSKCTSISVTENEKVLTENEITTPDNIDIYLERDCYSYNELDEMFYVIENKTNQKVITTEFYTIDYYSDGEWMPIEINQFWGFDKSIKILPNEKEEIPFWLPVNSTNFETGNYRFRTRISYPENNHSGDDLYMTFEIK